jgi:hypothetical protein
MSERAGPSSKDKGKGRAPSAEDVEAQGELIPSSPHATKFRHETDFESIEWKPFPGNANTFGSYIPPVIRSWNWIEGHCARRQDLITKQGRLLSEAVSALVERSDAQPIYNWYWGMNSVRHNIQDQLKAHGWWGRTLHRSLKDQRDEIKRCQNIAWEVLTKWKPDLEIDSLASIKGNIERLRREQKDTLEDQENATSRVAGKWDDQGTLENVEEQLRNQGGKNQLKDQGDNNQPKEVGYIVVALRSRASIDPQERLLKINHHVKFFKDLRRGINILRGWRGFFSLKSLKAFGLSKVS